MGSRFWGTGLWREDTTSATRIRISSAPTRGHAANFLLTMTGVKKPTTAFPSLPLLESNSPSISEITISDLALFCLDNYYGLLGVQ